MPRKQIQAASGPPGGLGMADRVRGFDWSGTPLGPRSGWPPSLRTAVDACLRSPLPTFVMWGPGLINIYNDAHVPVLGDRHPAALGRPGREVWADIWPAVAAEVEAVMGRGVPVVRERVRLDVLRGGRPRESYFTYSLCPIRDGRGRVGGFFQVCTDETARVLAERDGKAEAEAKLARWRAVTSGMREGIILADAAGNLLDVNRAAWDVHGYVDLDEGPAGRTFARVAETLELITLGGKPVGPDQWPIARLLRGEPVRDERYRVRRRDVPFEQVVSYTGTLIRNAAGDVSLALLTMHEDSGGTALRGGRPWCPTASGDDREDQRSAHVADEAAEGVEAMLHDMDLSVGEREHCKAVGGELVEHAIAAYLRTRRETKHYDGACIAASIAVALMIVREPT